MLKKKLQFSHNIKLFWLSLKNHPGLMLGYGWPLLLFVSITNRMDFSDLPWTNVLLTTFFLGLLPWIPIIWTSWTMRHQYDKENK